LTESETKSVPIEGHCDPRFARVREIFETQVAKNEVGAAIAFTLNGDSVVDLWGGYATQDHTKPWERDTIVTPTRQPRA